jgi:hypothetical protein
MPISFFEGLREEDLRDLNRRNMDRRFYALAAAIREHETNVRRDESEPATRDERLYRRLRQVCGGPATAEDGAA